MKIKKGSKLSVAIDNGDVKKDDFNMLSTFSESISDVCFLVSIPMKNGKSVVVDDDCKLIFIGKDSTQDIMFAAYVDEVVKVGIRNFWKIRKVADEKILHQRSDERLDCTLKVKYWQPTWEVNFDGEIEPEEGLTQNISGGGLAMYLPDVFRVGEFCEIELPKIGRTKAGQAITVVGEICWNREPSRGTGYKNMCGIKFNLSDDKLKKRMDGYVGTVKKYKS